MNNRPIESEIIRRLTDSLAPTRLIVSNDSAQHHGHLGDDGSGESHFRVMMRAASLAGQSRVQRHRAVHAALGAGLIGRIHALALDVSG